MTKKMLIDAAHPEEVRVALTTQGKIEDFDFETAAKKPLRGNIFLARVTRVEPSLQAAFVDYGGNRHGFLAFSEIHPDYYQIPVSDRKLLQEAEKEVAELAAALELSQRGDEDDDDDADDHSSEIENGAADEDGNSLSGRHAKEDDERHENELGDVQAASDARDSTLEENDDEEEDEEDEEEEDGEEDEANAESSESAEAALDASEKADVKPKRRRRSRKKTAKKTADEQSADDDENPAEAEQPWVELSDEPPQAHASRDSDRDADDTEMASDPGAQDENEDTNAAENDEIKSTDKNGSNARAERDALFERYKNAKRKRSQLLRNYKIQEVIKRRQILLIQVVKEERGTKGAALTTYLSLAGRYCVLMPNTARGGGISRKIATVSDRRRLRRVVDSLEVPQGMGLIIRTAGAKRTKTEIKRDYDYLLRLWENIRTLTLKSIAPCLVYEEASLIKRAIRDLYDKDISKVLVEGEAGYREAKDFMKMLMPSHAKNVQPYKDSQPIFLKHGIEAQLDGMYQPSVRLKSGGYIVIHQTEALVAIDVNSGRATRERNIEQTALRTNMEAAAEAARQFRLRDLAGLIVIDFIDMEESKNNRKVEKALKDALKADRARLQVGRISSFGLLELSRQRRRSGIVDGTTQSCPTCAGAGVIRSHETAALRILRAIEGEAISGKVGRIILRCSTDVALHILNHNRDWLQRIEGSNGVTIEILADPDRAGDSYDLEKSGAPRARAEKTYISADQTEPVEVSNDEDSESQAAEDTAQEEKREGGRKRRRRRRGGRKAADESSSENALASEKREVGAQHAPQDETAEQQKSETGEERDGDGRKKRRRGRRGGRRNKRNASSAEATMQSGDTDNEKSAENDGAAPADSSSNPQSADAPDNRPDNGPVRGKGKSAEVETADGGGDNAVSSPPSPSSIDSDKSDSGRRSGGDQPNAAATAADNSAQTKSDDQSAPVNNAEASHENTNGADNQNEEVQTTPKKRARKGWWQRAMG